MLCSVFVDNNNNNNNNNITGYDRTATVAHSRAVDDAIENSLPRFKHRSLRLAQCGAIHAVQSLQWH